MRKKLYCLAALCCAAVLAAAFWGRPQKGDALLPQQGHIEACYIQSPYTHEQGLAHTLPGGFDYLVTGDELEQLLSTFNCVDFKRALYPRAGFHRAVPGRSWELCFEYADPAGDMGRVAFTDQNYAEITLYLNSEPEKTRLFLAQSTAFLDFLSEHYANLPQNGKS